MDKTIRRFGSVDAMRTAAIRDWQRLPAGERMKAVTELSLELYRMKGLVKDDIPRLQRTLVRIQRPRG
jgi:hypothetical protein